MADDDLVRLHPDVAVNVRSLLRQIDRADEACLAAVRQSLLDARIALTTTVAGPDDPSVRIVTVMFNIVAQQRNEAIRRDGRELTRELESYLVDVDVDDDLDDTRG